MNKALMACAFAAIIVTGPLACAPLTDGINLSATLADEKALYAAEAAVFGANTAAEAAVDSGALRGARAEQVADALQIAYSALVTARAAYDAGNALQGSTASAAVLSAVADAYKIIQGK